MRASPRAWTERARATISSGWLLIALGSTACATPVVAPGSSTTPQPEPMDRIHTQAHAALERWADAVRRSGGASITFVGDLTSQIGAWEESNGGNKESLMAGMVEAATTLPADTPSRTEVKWIDGSTVEVNVLSAAASLAALVATAGGTECPECAPLLVTDAKLATGLVETSRGPAEAPTWVFTIQGTTVRVTRVAVDESITVDPPPWNAADPPEGISIESAVGAADSRKLEVSFTGAVDTADEPCGADYTAEAVESDLAVVVIVIEHRNPTEGACRAIGRTRTVEVTLETKLHDRAVLEVKQGLPVSVTSP